MSKNKLVKRKAISGEPREAPLDSTVDSAAPAEVVPGVSSTSLVAGVAGVVVEDRAGTGDPDPLDGEVGEPSALAACTSVAPGALPVGCSSPVDDSTVGSVPDGGLSEGGDAEGDSSAGGVADGGSPEGGIADGAVGALAVGVGGSTGIDKDMENGMDRYIDIDIHIGK
jgi:hypothetical protein